MTASFTVCQSQASSPATSFTVLPPPTCTVAHFAARVVNRQFLAAMRWSWSTKTRFCAASVETAHPMLSPRQPHRRAIDRQIDVANHGPLFHLRRLAADRTSHVADDLLDHELDIGTATFVVQDADVFQAHQRLEDLTRVGDDEGASCFVGSHLKPEAPSSLAG